MLGIGLDGRDGHTRLTRGKNFVLYGGSAETHATMRDRAEQLNDQLDRRGKSLEEVSLAELNEIWREISG
jgi:hypothetical protein